MSLQINQLPPHLAERTRSLNGGAPRRLGFVLYWMRTELRVEENPALDVARQVARDLGLPVFVYHGLGQNYRYASDRHHTFILEGARDVARQCQEMGLGYAFNLDRGRDGNALMELSKSSALVITEDMPVAPLTQWSDSLARSSGVPVWLVDTACIVPMSVVGKAYDRAYEFRQATERERRSRVEQPWPDMSHDLPYFVPELPFDPVDLDSADIATLVASCQIDHGVPPVLETRGGTTAGMARWVHFREGALKRYSRDRNDPLKDGVSRLSPYFHYGMISPFRIARECASVGGSGAEKYLDELLIWRELAYVFCRFRPDHESLRALPDWARQTLREHWNDQRAVTHSWETLARGQTGDRLWDLCQISLVRHGELHNNVRMTWGKALLQWTADPRKALDMAIDLNHRYALDGRDPASYGGLLWCFGLFDRPFQEDNLVTGTLRSRPTSSHARRLDLDVFERKVRRSQSSKQRIAIIGAGISGLAAGRCLSDHGHEVVVFEKSRGTGGRMATRRTSDGSFDHGAPFFRAQDRRFIPYVRSWQESGVLVESSLRLKHREKGGHERLRYITRYTGSPGISALGRHLARDLDVRFETRIETLERHEGQWVLIDSDRHCSDSFDRVVVSAPAPQADQLVSGVRSSFGDLRSVRYQPRFVLFGLARQSNADFDVALMESGPIHLVSRVSSGNGLERLCIHASTEWTRERLGASREDVTNELTSIASEEVPVVNAIQSANLHLWKYATVEEPLHRSCLEDPDLGLLVCGDFCLGSSVERAWLSGIAAAGRCLVPREANERRLSVTTLFD